MLWDGLQLLGAADACFASDVAMGRSKAESGPWLWRRVYTLDKMFSFLLID